MSDLESLSVKGGRELSAFMAQEMLYDHVCGNLDSERQQAMDRYLELNRDLALEAQRIKRGLEYLKLLGASQVQDEFVQKIAIPTTLFQVVLQKTKFHLWPAGFRWTLEALFVCSGIVVIAALVPWHKLTSIRWSRSSEIVLTEISKTYQEQPEKEVAQNDGSVVYPDESNVADALKASQGKEASSTTIQLAAIPADAKNASQGNAAPAPSTTMPVASAAPKKQAAAGAATSIEEATETTAGKTQGFLWRGTISVTNVPAITPKLVERLVALGGRKAGEVDLGWKKGTGSYFHFTAPEAKFDEVKASFAEFGSLNISRERHERVMPEGIVRIIITVSEKEGPKN